MSGCIFPSYIELECCFGIFLSKSCLTGNTNGYFFALDTLHKPLRVFSR